MKLRIPKLKLSVLKRKKELEFIDGIISILEKSSSTWTKQESLLVRESQLILLLLNDFPKDSRKILKKDWKNIKLSHINAFIKLVEELKDPYKYFSKKIEASSLPKKLKKEFDIALKALLFKFK